MTESAPSLPASASAPPRAWLPWLCALGFALAAWFLYTAKQDFPFYYHTDEPSKTEQIIRRQYNFHHPLLLLGTTELLIKATHTPREAQPVVEKGRQASALFAALSVAAVVLLAWRIGGAPAGLLAGTLTTTHALLFELSHYMKEDCALLAGLTWTALALAAYGQRPTLGRAALVGLAAAFALSGKYLGGVMSGTALLAVALIPRELGKRHAAVLVAIGVMATGVTAINAPGIANLNRLSSSLNEEMEKVRLRGEERPEGIKFKHLSKLGTTISAPLLLGLGYWIVRRWRERGPIVWRLLGAFTVGYFLLVSLAPKTKERYLLPVVAFSCALGAAGLVEWIRRQPPPRRRWTGAGIAAIALGWHLPAFIADWRGFAQDDRRDLTAWLREHVPPTEGIAHDIRVQLLNGQKSGRPGYVLPNPLFAPEQRYLPDVGSLEQLRSQGVTHVVVCERDYHSALAAEPGSRRREFYETLFKNKPLWERPPGPLEYHQPGLKVYNIADL